MSPSAETTTRPLNGELQLALATADEDIDAPEAFAVFAMLRDREDLLPPWF
jgi:hypothetical protein